LLHTAHKNQEFCQRFEQESIWFSQAGRTFLPELLCKKKLLARWSNKAGIIALTASQKYLPGAWPKPLEIS